MLIRVLKSTFSSKHIKRILKTNIKLLDKMQSPRNSNTTMYGKMRFSKMLAECNNISQANINWVLICILTGF